MARVSVGQACANALRNWLDQALTDDVTVYDRWPEPNVPLFASPTPGEPPARAVVTVVKVGKRRRLEVVSGLGVVTQSPESPTMAQVQFNLGSVMQPIQIDIWTKTDDDRDDLIAQLDDALSAGEIFTLGIPSSPVRDGIVLSLNADTAWAGQIADYFFDEPEIYDAPDSAQTSEYRATYFGEARTPFSSTRSVTLMNQLILAQQLNPNATPPPSQLWELFTMSQNATPPPTLKVVKTTASQP